MAAGRERRKKARGGRGTTSPGAANTIARGMAGAIKWVEGRAKRGGGRVASRGGKGQVRVGEGLGVDRLGFYFGIIEALFEAAEHLGGLGESFEGDKER